VHADQALDLLDEYDRHLGEDELLVERVQVLSEGLETISEWPGALASVMPH